MKETIKALLIAVFILSVSLVFTICVLNHIVKVGTYTVLEAPDLNNKMEDW